MLTCVVKIDLCGSKMFASRQEKANPQIRKQALEKLLEVAEGVYPSADQPIPDGSYYKAEGDAVYYLVSHATVALRSTFEFMRTWYYEALADFPDCRVIITQGEIAEVPVPSGIDYVGKPFESISVFEKDLGDGQIYVTKEIVDDCDPTMVWFSLYREYSSTSGDGIIVFSAEFSDPRTTTDSSLIHALFVANPQATAARERVIELFLMEYALENGRISGLQDVGNWCQKRGYPTCPEDLVHRILNESNTFSSTIEGENTYYQLTDHSRELIKASQQALHESREECIAQVIGAIHQETHSQESTEEVNLEELIEEYLCAVFSELRVMANYFRETHHLFKPDSPVFGRFDYIVGRYCPGLTGKYFDEWKAGFIKGLRLAAQADNLFIASVFHNVLSTYYLNRSPAASAYQVALLKERCVYFDTNILYSLLVRASNYHDLVKYFVDQFRPIGLVPLLFPFTIEEYENSLLSVERQCYQGRPSQELLKRNPWIWQEFSANRGTYLNSFPACRRMHSITNGKPVTEENDALISEKLQRHFLAIERDFTEFPDSEVDDLWVGFRTKIMRDQWELDRFWDFIHRDAAVSKAIIGHDVHCIQNLVMKNEEQLPDELGCRNLFITVDSKLLSLNKEYEFILSPEQFLEFFLPYLFLADIPLMDAQRFPNSLLAAGLSTVLANEPPDIVEWVKLFLENRIYTENSDKEMPVVAKDLATALNNERYREVVDRNQQEPQEDVSELAREVAQQFEQDVAQDREDYYKALESFRGQITQQERQIGKLHRTVHYWRQQAKRRD